MGKELWMQYIEKRRDTETNLKNHWSWIVVLFVCSLTRVFIYVHNVCYIYLFYIFRSSGLKFLFGIFSDIAMHTGSPYHKAVDSLFLLSILCLSF